MHLNVYLLSISMHMHRVTLSNDEISDHKCKSDQEGNFMAFIATAIVSEIEIVDENF